MQIIVPHASTDLDAFGAAAGLRVLYPSATVVLPGTVLPGAAAFASLHRYHLPTRPARDVDLERVDLVVVADTADRDRLGAVAEVVGRPGVRLHLYDHHPREPGDLQGELEVWEPVGAASTLVAELIEEAGAALSPQTATALLLGIYADTSFLTLPSTTPRDARAAAFLLERGANLALAERFVSPDLTPAQQELLAQLLASERLHTVRGVRVRVAPGETQGYVGGLALVVHRLLDLRPAPATFVAVRMGDRVHLVGRSGVPWVDARAALAPFGGGGHPGAAAAVVRGRGLEEVVQALLESVERTAGQPLTARDLMKAPVRAVAPDRTVAEAERLMLRYGYSGLVVTEGSRVVGVVSRADTERARRHGLAHAPVKGVMSRPAVTIPPSMPLDEVQGLMIERGVGRLPVVEDGQLVGIVTRSDVLGELYGGSAPHWHRRLHGSPGAPPEATVRAREHQASLPPAVRDVLRAAGCVARDTAQPAYAVGGFLRDLLLGRPNTDVDIAVEGDGIAFAARLAAVTGGSVHPVPRFGTAHVILPGGLRVDVATARREFYEHAAALPQVEHADLREDLYRRDFTINALAARLTPDGPGEVVDFFGGYRDLEAGLIRVLHSLSFVEDPTRVLRAVRFACRYGFRLEAETGQLAREAVSGGLLLRLSPHRLRAELVLILSEETAAECLDQLAALGALDQVLPGLRWGDAPRQALRAAGSVLGGRDGEAAPVPAAIRDLVRAAEPWLVRAVCLAPGFEDPGLAVRSLADRLELPRRARRVLARVLPGWRDALERLAQPEVRPSQVVELLEGWPPEGLVLLWLLGQEGAAAGRVRRYLEEWRHVRPRIGPEDLRRAGVPPGPACGRALAAARRARLDGVAATPEEELEAGVEAALASE